MVFFGFLIIGCTPSPEKLILEYVQAHNLHYIDDAMSYYTDDIEFTMVGTWVKKGKVVIRKLEEWDASVGGTLSFDNLHTEGNVITCSGKETNQWFKLVDIDTVYYKLISFTLHDNKISKIKAELDSSSHHQIQSALISIMTWASVQKPEMLSTLIPNNEFEYSYENGENWIQLLKEWKTVKK
jgi:hypothetical protein